MTKTTNNIVAIAAAIVLPFFAVNAHADDSVTQAEAQQIRMAAIEVEASLEMMHEEMRQEHNADVVAMTQLNIEQQELEVEEELASDEEYQELIAD
ncbi:hypothetical protein [Thalassotalea crassostreae]|uniref:hypothetical protein n=1 Tax=Thalassotalea crassostreae TaxID=1763536 RepID=UPI0008A533C2|nr:hypothetical protein [Thalassotalea crassostreae]